jgi:hypothetical protein
VFSQTEQPDIHLCKKRDVPMTSANDDYIVRAFAMMTRLPRATRDDIDANK